MSRYPEEALGLSGGLSGFSWGEPTMTELHTAYVYALAHLANLGERSALKLKRLFATYDDWLAKAPSDRRAKIEEAIGARYATRVATNWDDLIEQALKELRRHRSEEHTSELQSLTNLVCRLLL